MDEHCCLNQNDAYISPFDKDFLIIGYNQHVGYQAKRYSTVVVTKKIK